MVSCTSVKRDDHSYSYYYQHNEKPSDETSLVPKPRNNKRVEYTTYKQEYNNYKTQESDAEYLDGIDDAPFYSNGMKSPACRSQRQSNRKDFNPFDNQFINSSHKANKNQEERIPDVFGPDGYVNVQTRVPNSNPPIINNVYYPASMFK